MHILVTNDDGPPSNQLSKSSPYIHSFVRTLQSAGHTVSVVLPHQQRSWIGKAHFAAQVVKPTYFRPGTLHQDDGTTHTKPLTAGDGSNDDTEEWVLVNSTPATAAQLGLFHFFQDRGPVDLVVSGPNYGRNTTSLFSLSSGTIGGAMEAAICRKRAIALSYAFFSRNHDPEIIAGASRMSVKLIEHLMSKWDEGVDLYSVNVPLVEGVEGKKVFYTYALQNYWKSGSSFTEVEAEEGDDPAEKEVEIRAQEELGSEKVKGEAVGAGAEIEKKHARHKHRHFTWTPNFSDVYQSVETSEPGNDGWAVKEGLISVTPLKSNFMPVPGLQGELKLDRGQGIRLFSSESELRAIFEEWEADSPDSDSDSTATPPSTPNNTTTTAIPTSQLRHFIAQAYIPPFLFPSPSPTSPLPSHLNQITNRKFHIRTYVLCTSALRVYVYQEMLALFAAVPYTPPGNTTLTNPDTNQEEMDMRPHLTNTCLQSSPFPSPSSPSPSPSTPPSTEKPLVLPLTHLPFPSPKPPESPSPQNPNTPTPTNPNLTNITTQINTLTSSLFLAATSHPVHFQPLPNAFEVYGLDYLISETGDVFLLEVNAFPDFAQSGGGGQEVIAGLWRAVIAIAVKGFFSSDQEEEGEEEKWGMKKVLDVDLGRR
ncbi:MAG: hypothetical protein LQ350_005403 [Teloschistes chrysophthalmus]|nr:MAG: hypothetical protein LQ350_005403 [Niorma chrysophthalma]